MLDQQLKLFTLIVPMLNIFLVVCHAKVVDVLDYQQQSIHSFHNASSGKLEIWAGVDRYVRIRQSLILVADLS